MKSIEPYAALPGSLLLTDLYQLNMMQAHFDGGLTDQAVFEFFVRKLPDDRNFLVAAEIRRRSAEETIPDT